MYISRIILSLAAALSLGACVQAPVFDGAGDVRFDQIVKLLKCDIARSVSEKIKEGVVPRPGENKFDFLANWAAKVHLTIAVDSTSSFNPGVTFIEPLVPAGTSRSLGLGVGIATQAVAQKDVEFFLSFQELGQEFHDLQVGPGFGKYDDCKPASGFLLESDLHLKSILDTALEPVANGTLTRGIHPALSSSPTANLAAAERTLNNYLKSALGEERKAPPDANILAQSNSSIQHKLQSILKFNNNNKEDADKVVADVADADKIEREARAIISNVVTPLYEIAAASFPDCLGDEDKQHPGITSNKNQAVVSASLVSVAKIDVDQAQDPNDSAAALKIEKARQKDTVGFAKALVSGMNKCSRKPAVVRPVPLYDPVSTISETVNFYITSTGSLAPAWKLVRVAAPVAGNLLSGIRKDTNTLIIAMGRPDTKDGKAAGPSAAMNQQVLASLLGQAILNAPR